MSDIETILKNASNQKFPFGRIYSDPNATIDVIYKNNVYFLLYTFGSSSKIQVQLPFTEENPEKIQFLRFHKGKPINIYAEESCRHVEKVAQLIKSTGKYPEIIDLLKKSYQNFTNTLKARKDKSKVVPQPKKTAQAKSKPSATQTYFVNQIMSDSVQNASLQDFQKTVFCDTVTIMEKSFTAEITGQKPIARQQILAYLQEHLSAHIYEYVKKTTDHIRVKNLRKKAEKLALQAKENAQKKTTNPENIKIIVQNDLLKALTDLVSGKILQGAETLISSFDKNGTRTAAIKQILKECIYEHPDFAPRETAMNQLKKYAQQTVSSILTPIQKGIEQQLTAARAEINKQTAKKNKGGFSQNTVLQKIHRLNASIAEYEAQQLRAIQYEPVLRETILSSQKKAIETYYDSCLSETIATFTNQTLNEIFTNTIPNEVHKVLREYISDYIDETVKPIISAVTTQLFPSEKQNEQQEAEKRAQEAEKEAEQRLQADYAALFDKPVENPARIQVYQKEGQQYPIFFRRTPDCISEMVLNPSQPAFYMWEKENVRKMEPSEFIDFFSDLEPFIESNPELTENIMNASLLYQKFIQTQPAALSQNKFGSPAQKSMIERHRQNEHSA